MRHTREPRRLAIGLLVPLVALAACGDDIEDEAVAATTAPIAATVAATTAPTVAATTAPATAPTVPATAAPDTTAGIDAALEEYCTLAAELNAQPTPPTSEQLAAYQAVAPDAIAADVAAFIVAFDAAGGDFAAVFADPAAGAAVEAIAAFEGEACGLESGGTEQDPSVTQLDPDAARIDVTATDYHFDVEPPSQAGRYSFVLTNAGAEVHIMILAQLEEGMSIEDVMASEGEVGVIQSFESDIAPPGMEAVVTADLTPGRWVLVCPIPNADGTPHAALGMVHEFTIA